MNCWHPCVLQDLFPVEAWPPTAAVRELATKLKASKKDGIENPFIYMDLKKFLPPCFRDHAPSTIDDVDKPAGNKANKRLDLGSWLIAWDRCFVVLLGFCVGYVCFCKAYIGIGSHAHVRFQSLEPAQVHRGGNSCYRIPE